MATYRVILKRPVWDNITPVTSGYSFTGYTSTGGSPVSLTNTLYIIQDAMGIAANVTSKSISINDLSVIGQTAISSTIYAIQNGPTLYSPSLCFSYSGTLYIIKLLIEGCGEA